MSATPDSTLAIPEQFIADLQRQLAVREAELAECKAERDEALQRVCLPIMPSERSAASTESLSFERDRFTFCQQLFAGEVVRKDMLERKTTLYLTFTGLFLGATFLKLDSLLNFLAIPVSNRGVPATLFLGSIGLALGMLVSSVLFIWLASQLRFWWGFAPPNAPAALFASSKYNDGSSSTLLKQLSVDCIIAWNHNREVNDRISRIVILASYAILASVVSIFVAIIGQLLFHFQVL